MTERLPDPRRPWRALRSMRHARRSLAGKLMVVMLITTLIALSAAGAALIFTDLRDSRANWSDDLRTEAGIVAFAVQPALSFNDHARAERNLSSLQARESISAAALYTRSEEHTSELQSRRDLVCRLLLEKKKKNNTLLS